MNYLAKVIYHRRRPCEKYVSIWEMLIKTLITKINVSFLCNIKCWPANRMFNHEIVRDAMEEKIFI